MKIALAQMNATVGDVAGNTERIIEGVRRACDAGAHLVLFPELAVIGYPPKDLLLRRSLIETNVRAVSRIATECTGVVAVVGFVHPREDAGTGLCNAAAVCYGGTIAGIYAKMLLPTYDVFDESRYFTPRREPLTFPVDVDGHAMRVGVTICEDLWHDRQFGGRPVYGVDPVAETVRAGAEVIINIGASPFFAGKQAGRERLFTAQAAELGVAIVTVNAVGGQDDLLFDGASFALDKTGRVTARAKAFEEDFLVVDVHHPSTDQVRAYPDDVGSIHDGLVLGVRDYMRRCGFKEAVVGLSGGIDSAVTAAIAAKAIGAHNLHGVGMPSRFSSEHSIEDARNLAENLGIDFNLVPIDDVHRAMEQAVQTAFARRGAFEFGVAEENMQARIRGAIVMAMSNKFGWMLLTTGNKSEISVGYCTLYGDMCGGLAVLSDVPKTIVYALAKRINESMPQPVIPRRTIEKPPSAELRPEQEDTDSLPPYEVLDAILQRYVERDESADEIIAAGFDPATVRRVVHMVDSNEYKRSQMPVGLKVTTRAFGSGRRMPIAAKYT